MKRIIIGIVVSTVLLLATMGLTSPNAATLPIYLVAFSLVYIFCVLVISLILKIGYSHLADNKRYFIAVVIGFTPTILLALASLSDLSLIDILLAFGLPAAIAWYGLKSDIVK